jgi:hypothetical protein
MCAINPRHKKRINFDFYTGHDMTAERFEEIVTDIILRHELDINSAHGDIRVHAKESDQQAD